MILRLAEVTLGPLLFMTSTTPHVHKAALLGSLQGEFGGSFPIRACVDCGTIFMFEGSHVWELIPTIAQAQSVTPKMPMTLVAEYPYHSRKQPNVLGRSLKDIKESSIKMTKLPGEK